MKRNNQIPAVRVSDAEREIINAAADKVQLTLSDFVRQAVLRQAKASSPKMHILGVLFDGMVMGEGVCPQCLGFGKVHNVALGTVPCPRCKGEEDD
jgi:hypothetical protein